MLKDASVSFVWLVACTSRHPETRGPPACRTDAGRVAKAYRVFTSVFLRPTATWNLLPMTVTGASRLDCAERSLQRTGGQQEVGERSRHASHCEHEEVRRGLTGGAHLVHRVAYACHQERWRLLVQHRHGAALLRGTAACVHQHDLTSSLCALTRPHRLISVDLRAIYKTSTTAGSPSLRTNAD